MKKIRAKIWDLIKIYTTFDGEYKYSLDVVDGEFIISLVTGSFILSSALLSSLEEFKKELSSYLDCSYLVFVKDNKPCIRFFIENL